MRVFGSKKKKSVNMNDKSLWYSLQSNFKNLTGDEFEELIARLYRKKGFRVYKTPKGPDDGVDLIVRKGITSIVIQCKNWEQKVGNGDVLKTAGARQLKNATYALVITSSQFTEPAKVVLKKTPKIRGMAINGLKREFRRNFKIVKPVQKKSTLTKLGEFFRKNSKS